MKTKTMIATVILATGLGFSAVITPANASSWHKGTPKALSGSYQSKMIKSTGPYSMVTKMFIRKSSAPFYTFSYKNKREISNSPMMGIASSAKYKKLSHTLYEIVGSYKFNNGSAKMFVKSYGHHKIKYTFAKSFQGQPIMYKY